MAKIEELAKEYAKKILNSRNHRDAAKEVIDSINSLTYEKSKKPISQDDIDLIIKLIEEYLKKGPGTRILGYQDRTLSKYQNRDLLLENTDTSGFNDIIEMMTQGTRK